MKKFEFFCQILLANPQKTTKCSFFEAEIKRSSFIARGNTIAAPSWCAKRSFFDVRGNLTRIATWLSWKFDTSDLYTVYSIQYIVYTIENSELSENLDNSDEHTFVNTCSYTVYNERMFVLGMYYSEKTNYRKSCRWKNIPYIVVQIKLHTIYSRMR